MKHEDTAVLLGHCGISNKCLREIRVLDTCGYETMMFRRTKCSAILCHDWVKKRQGNTKRSEQNRNGARHLKK
jgi:hypothetical protein